jgi:peroxiredoxin
MTKTSIAQSLARLRNTFLYLSLIAVSVGAAGVADAAAKGAFPKEGLWRGEFSVNGDKLPFNFEVKGKNTDDGTLTVINGTRRDVFKITRSAPDTIFVRMNTYDAAIEAKVESSGKLVGEYRSLVPSQRGGVLPFVAEYGKKYRFVEPTANVAPASNLSGKWAIQIVSKEPAPNQVALLKQDGNALGGVFMTVVGDTRELEGTVQGNHFYLSGFSGPSPVLVQGTIDDEDGSIAGAVSFGIYRTVKFEGRKQANVELPDPYELTYLKPGFQKLDFTFPNLEGRPVSLSDDKYKGKVVIVEVIGTWCPNCTDQTRFLAPWFRANQQRGVEAIAVAFEQEDNFDYFKQTLTKFKDFFDIRYDLVFGGIADKKVATEKLQGLNYMAAFPTTIIIDRKGTVRQIYTGYTGEITGDYYKDYVKRFNTTLDALISEPNPYDQKLTSNAAGPATAKDSPRTLNVATAVLAAAN